MGIFYSQSALLHKRLASQSAADRRKHNSSTVNLAGYTRDEIKKRVRESDQFTSTEKALLAYVADQNPAKFVFCVKTAQDALSISEYQWVQTRRKLEGKHILAQQMVPISDGSHHWFLDFDFSHLRDAKYDAQSSRENRVEKMEPSIYNRAGACAHTIPKKLGDKPLKAQPAAPLVGAGGKCAGNEEEDRGPLEAGQPGQPRKKTKRAPPAPPGGRAVLHNPQGTEIMNEKNFKEAGEFFNWLGRNGVLSARLAAQVRKKSDGQRGAPMGLGQPGKPVAEGPPVRTAAAAHLAQSLLARLQKMGKSRLELVTAAARTPQGLSKSILIDDLDEGGVRLLKTKWRGPGAILETSPGNFQAILILPEPMGKAERKSITDQLVAVLGADDGATSDGQFHRLPGSVNYKPALAEPFTTRLVEYFIGAGEGVQPIRPVARSVAAPVSVVRPGALRSIRKRRWVSPAESISQEAFRLAVDLLDSGASAPQVEAALSAPEWLRHHSAADWPTRTREKAEKFRAGELYGYGRGGVRHA